MVKTGKLIICDCCHKEIFLEQLKEAVDLDVGYIRHEIFRDKLKEWQHSYDLKMDLCPNCSKKMEDAKQRVLNSAMDLSQYSVQVPI